MEVEAMIHRELPNGAKEITPVTLRCTQEWLELVRKIVREEIAMRGDTNNAQAIEVKPEGTWPIHPLVYEEKVKSESAEFASALHSLGQKSGEQDMEAVSSAFGVGDQVKLKSGGPLMTIRYLLVEDDVARAARVEWVVDGHVCSHTFPLECLVMSGEA